MVQCNNSLFAGLGWRRLRVHNGIVDLRSRDLDHIFEHILVARGDGVEWRSRGLITVVELAMVR